MLQSDYWVKKNHTLLVSGHVAMILFIGNLFSKNDAPIQTLRNNLDYFIPFLLGLLFLLGTGLRGMKLDSYRSLLNLKNTLINSKGDVEEERIRLTSLKFVNSQIKKMSKSIKTLKWVTNFTLYASATCLIVGILMLAFGDIVLEAISNV